MPYALGFYLYLFVIGVVVTALAVWLAPYGLLVNFDSRVLGPLSVDAGFLNKPDGL
jgi:hypothetical protein